MAAGEGARIIFQMTKKLEQKPGNTPASVLSINEQINNEVLLMLLFVYGWDYPTDCWIVFGYS